MLDVLDTTLESLLQRELPPDVPAPGTDVEISFEAPYSGNIDSPINPTINLFLYDVRENLEYRQSKWLLERNSNGKAFKTRPPAMVDCSYLITAWPKNNDDVETEHQLLGEVMRVLVRYQRIPEAFVPEDWEGGEIPLRLFSLRPSLLQSFGEFWQAMAGKEGNKPKAVLHCTVTISVPRDEIAEEVGLVGVFEPTPVPAPSSLINVGE